MERLLYKNPDILVIGDLMVDHYLWGSSERISPEAPVLIVDVENESKSLGGAGNVINNLLSFGSNVGVLSVIGDDETGEFIKETLLKKGVRDEGIFIEKGRKTSKKSRVVALHQQIVRVDKESRNDIDEKLQKKILERFSQIVKNYDAVLLSDYGKGVLTKTLTEEIIKEANKRGKKVFVDPKGDDYSKYKGAFLITPNKKEASLAAKIDIKDEESLKEAGFKLKRELDLDYAVITLSEEGMAIFSEDMIKIPTLAKEVYDVTGAGDTVLAAFGYAISCGFDIKESAYFANSAAAVVVGKIGSATATIEEVISYGHALHKCDSGEKIVSKENILNILKNHQDKKVVFTNGCFDILHTGHVKYLQKAKSFGDILIIGLNSDDSVKRLKGEGRPINGFEDRAYLLSALECVDFVVGFEEDTPYELIKAIKPDILVKGADYKDKEVVGSDIAKEVRLVEFVEGKSTTNIINKVIERVKNG